MRARSMGISAGLATMGVLMAGVCLAAAPKDADARKSADSPFFRGPNGSGFYPDATAVTSWSEKAKKNIRWKAALDLPGWSSPVVWGDRVVVTAADADKRQVYCFATDTGKSVWKTEVEKVDGATTEYKLDTMDARWDTLLHAGATPATNGKQVFTLFSNGQLTALDLATGKQLWSVALGDTSDNKYGLDSSLLVSGGSVIVVFQGGEMYIASYDAATGKPLWKTKRTGSTWSSPILYQTRSGKDLVALFSDPAVTAWDVQTGKQVWNTSVITESPQYCVGPSPVFADNRIFVNYEKNGVFALDAEKGDVIWSLKTLPDESDFSASSSMTTDGTFLYQFLKSMLTVVDAATGKVVKQQELGDSSSDASPLLVGKNLYLVCGSSALVVSAGKTPVKVGEGSLSEGVDATPAFAAGTLYFRTAKALYAIGN